MAVGFYVVEYATKPNNQPWDAEILCYSSGPPADAQNLIGAVRFFRDSSHVAPGANVDGKPVLNYPLQSFQDVMSIFRNEADITANRIFGDTVGGTWDAWAVIGIGTPH
jgi:hypothetical protein